MATVPVRFTYYTSVGGEAFPGHVALLTGNWDAAGRASPDWTRRPMERFVADDGGTAFRATVEFDAAEVGHVFHWGVVLRDPAGRERWAIATETPDVDRIERHRTFTLTAAPGSEDYYLAHCRRLGSHKRHGGAHAAARFAVWAPNARRVDVVFAAVWSTDDPTRTPTRASLPIDKICGGYIADDGTGIDPALPVLALQRGSGGVWETDPHDPALARFADFRHRAYLFRIEQEDGRVAYRTDLYSRCQLGYGRTNPAKATPGQPWLGPISTLDGGVSCTTVVDLDEVTRDFVEQDQVWPERVTIPADEFWADEFTGRKVPTRVEDLIIYELHVGALGFGHAGPGTLQDAMELLDHLSALNVTAVELLPMCEFGGAAENWGYATSHFFAIEYSEGGRDQYKHFIKECHRRGLAVIVDMVYNHFAHEAERAEYHYDSSAPENDIYYWYEGRATDYQRPDGTPFPEGGYVDNLSTAFAPRYSEEMVRKLFISSAVALVREFHVDGLRLDQTTSIHAYNVLHADGRPVGAANAFGAKLLRELGRTVRMFNPDAILIAEDHSTWDQVTRPVDEDGMGFDARWYADFCHHLAGDTDKGADYAKLIYHAALLGAGAPAQLDYFAGALAASRLQAVVYAESHDEAGNSKGPFFDPTATDADKQHTSHRSLVVASNEASLIGPTRAYAEARCRYEWGVTVLSAGTPMLLFGQECGAVQRFKYNAVLAEREDLATLRSGTGAALVRFFADLNRLRRDHSALRSRNIDVLHVHNANRVLAWKRWDDAQSFLIVASLNDAAFDRGYTIEHPHIEPGTWREIFNSDSRHYGGADVGNGGGSIWTGGGRFSAVLPFAGFVVFAHERNQP
ncbi:alpha-amylase family glycosyl hydrolase [Opitutus terrae]|uniref:1,4-alpha-glucan branching enzyme n=1 Tax=Opitutus terrae (strain DSM 11246 / JCM 15787 / PB90-1) TaxID=452637 RepID=B1ZQF2_OPITP|nr:alpha-amylase family glycosyl hydrolase [Opitutus terrae]ACB73632.1 alpha amylase all-beta [Opitutus terrae PB90-1]